MPLMAKEVFFVSKQVKFKDLENNEIHGGILLDNGDVVCGECGGIQEAADRGSTWDIIKEFPTWVNLDNEILGDDFEDDSKGKPMITICRCKDCGGFIEVFGCKGTCFQNGDACDGSEIGLDCLHSTLGMQIMAEYDGIEELITSDDYPFYNNQNKSAIEIVSYILSQPDDSPEGILVLRKELQEFLDDNDLPNFDGVALSLCCAK